MEDLLLITSLISLGFFGGFTHCAGMCGPFVITQVSNRLQKIPIKDFTFAKKTFEISLIPYHLGRITTYSLIGFSLSLINQNIEDALTFKYISVILLGFATIFFLNVLFDEKISTAIKKVKLISIKNPITCFELFNSAINKMIVSPSGFSGYLLGIFLGFLPCGLLYGAFLISASCSNPFFAMIGMALFGSANFPALFIAGYGGSLIKKLPEFRIIFKIFILINIALLIKVIWSMLA